MKKQESHSKARPRRLFFLMGLLLAWGCSSGSSSCGGCLQPIPGGFPAALQIDGIAQIGMTRKGFDFFEKNINPLLQQFLPNGLAFDIPPSKSGDLEVCLNPPCKVNGNIRSVKINLLPPQTIQADLLVDISSSKIKIKYKIPIFGSITCDVEAKMSNKPIKTDIKVTASRQQKHLNFEVGTPSFSLANSDFKLSGGLQCTVIDLLKGLFKSMIEKEIKKALEDAVGDLNCLKCKTPADCPSGATCKDDRCEAAGKCLPNPLGAEGQVDTAALLGGFGSGKSHPLGLSFFVGGSAEVKTTGLFLGSFGGTQADPHPCVVKKTWPAQAAPAPFPFPATAPDGQSYMAGAGISQVFLTQMMRDLYHTGLFCLRLDESLSSQLGTFFRAQAIGAAISPSLLQIVGSANPPLYIELKPSTEPTIAIGKGTFTTNAQGQKELTDPLLEITIPKLDFDFYMHLHDRWVRLFTYRVDLYLPLGLEVRPQNKLGVVLGDLKTSFRNAEVLNSNLLKEEAKVTATSLSGLLQAVLPLLVGQIGQQEFELPELQGFLLTIRGIAGQIPRTDLPSRFQYLALFADLSLAPPSAPLLPAPEVLSARVLRQITPPTLHEDLRFGRPLQAYPSLVIAIDDPRFQEREYAFRINKSPWHPFSPASNASEVVLSDPQFLMQGEHFLHFRARHRLAPQGQEVGQGDLVIRIDTIAPTVAFRLDPQGQGVLIEASDNLDKPGDLRMEVRLSKTDLWRPLVSGWLPLAELPIGLPVSVRVIDQAGNIAASTYTRPLQTPVASLSAETAHLSPPSPATPTSPPQEKPVTMRPMPAFGCSSLPFSASFGPLAFLLLALGLFRRRS